MFISVLALKGRVVRGGFRMRALRFTSLVRVTSWFFFKSGWFFGRIVDPSFLAGSGFGSADKIKKRVNILFQIYNTLR